MILDISFLETKEKDELSIYGRSVFRRDKAMRQ